MTDSARQRPRHQQLEPDRPEPSLWQLLQQAHSRDGERLLAPDDDPNPFTVEKQIVPSDRSGPEPGPTPSLRGQQPPEAVNEAAALHDLAEKIGSILADDARRHGIDV